MKTRARGRIAGDARPETTARFVTAIALAWSSACGGDPGARVDGSRVLRVVEEARIDRMAADLVSIPIDGPIQFRDPGVMVARDGSIAVIQRQDHLLRRFNASGELLGTVGRQGEGPGEFMSLGPMGWIADTLWVRDRRLDRVTFISPGGEVLRSARFLLEETPLDASPASTFRPFSLMALATDGSVLAVGSTPEGLSLVRLAPPASASRLFVAMRQDDYREILVDGGAINGDVFSTFPVHSVSPDGRLVASARSNLDADQPRTFALTVFRADGDTVFRREYPFDPVPVTQSAADSTIEAILARLGGAPPAFATALRRDAYIPAVYPPILDIVLTHDGTIWLRLRDTAEGRPYLVLDPAGHPIGTVTFDTNTVVAAVRDDWIWAVELDEFDVPSLVRYSLESRY